MDKSSTAIYMNNLESKDRKYNLCLQRFFNPVEEQQHLFPERQNKLVIVPKSRTFLLYLWESGRKEALILKYNLRIS